MQKIHLELKRRQIQVICKAAVGKTNAEIGRDLGIAEQTVKNYLRQVEDMLRVVLGTNQLHNRTELCLFIIFGFLPTELDIERIIYFNLKGVIDEAKRYHNRNNGGEAYNLSTV